VPEASLQRRFLLLKCLNTHLERALFAVDLSSKVPYRNVQWFRGGLVFKAFRLLYHSTLGLRVTKKKKRCPLEARNAVKIDFGVWG